MTRQKNDKEKKYIYLLNNHNYRPLPGKPPDAKVAGSTRSADCDCGWKPAEEVMALLDKEDTASTSGLDERGDILAILDQIQWQCPTCHIILGGTHNSCTKPDCKGTKYTALKELLVLLGRLFVSGVEEECDSPNVITLADYVNTLLDAH